MWGTHCTAVTKISDELKAYFHFIVINCHNVSVQWMPEWAIMGSLWFSESVSNPAVCLKCCSYNVCFGVNNTPLMKWENLWVFPLIKNWPISTYKTETEEVTLMLCYKCSKSRTFVSGYFGFTFFFQFLHFVKSLITFSSYFASDMRFLRRPQYGEYKYLPKSLW